MANVIQQTLDAAAPPPSGTSRRDKNEDARCLLKQWLADTSGYDERTWPEAQDALSRNALSLRDGSAQKT